MTSPALTPVLIEHYDELVDYVHRRFASHDFAHDVIHEVCLQLLSHPPQDHILTPLAYLRQMSLHRALDWCRSQSRRQTQDSGQEALASYCHHEDGAALLAFQQQLEALVRIIEDLPARQRQCFLLNRVHGMEHEAIAEAIGISRSAVSHHVGAAIRQIMAQWEPAREYAQWLQRRTRKAVPAESGKPAETGLLSPNSLVPPSC